MGRIMTTPPLDAVDAAEAETLTDAEWQAFQAIPDQGYSHRSWIDQLIAERIARVRPAEREAALWRMEDVMAKADRFDGWQELLHQLRARLRAPSSQDAATEGSGE